MSYNRVMEISQEVRQVFSQLGKKRFEGKSKEEIKKMMSDVRKKGIEKKKLASKTA